jgi:hypothetical protein
MFSVSSKARGKDASMLGLSNRFAARVTAIQRKVSARPTRAGKAGFRDLSARLSKARKQVAAARRGH